MELRINQQRLERINDGYNFFNIIQKEKKYFIKVMLETEMDLLEKEETIKVYTDLPLSDWDYCRDYEVIDFLKEFENFVKKPLVRIRDFNRKNMTSSYELSYVRVGVREKILKFSDIEITIGELAERKLKVIGIEDFKEKVKELLNLQKGIDEKIQKLVDRFIQLKERIATLKECIGKKDDGYIYYCGYGKEVDKTIKITLTAEQYNQELKEIEKGMREIAHKLKIEVRDSDFEYVPIERKVGFNEWLEINKGELKESWAEFDSEDKKAYKSFKGYCEEMYDECSGVIVENGGSEDFDEEDEELI